MSSKRNNTLDIHQIRKKIRNTKDIGVLLHLVHASNDNVYEAAEDLVNSRKKLHESRVKLSDITAEVEHLRNEVHRKKNNLQAVTAELRKAASQLQALDVNKLKEQEALLLKLDTWLVEEDVVEAWKQINFAEEDLNKETKDFENVNKRKRRKVSKEDIRTFNSVSIPNVVSSGIISLNGSININRNKCCICLERRLNAVLYKCGHICLCYICASELMKTSENKKCPVCRTDIIDVIKTYLA